MAATYTPIASITLGANASSVTFSSIPQTYTDLVLVFDGTITTAASTPFQLNSDTGSNYSMTRVYGDGSSVTSTRNSSETSGLITIADTGQSNFIANFMNYSNTTTYKTVISRGGTAGGYTTLIASLWRSTAAITSISLITVTYASGSTFNLYGILGANA
jgi:hypothetical protein